MFKSVVVSVLLFLFLCVLIGAEPLESEFQSFHTLSNDQGIDQFYASLMKVILISSSLF